MAETVRATTRRRVQLPVLDSFLWLLRIGFLVIIVWGATASIASGRLSASQWQSLVVAGLSQGSVYALIALGYTMVYGVLRFINFAHGEVFMAGAMTGFFVTTSLSQTALWTTSPFIVLGIGLLASVSVSTLLAVLLERIAYRPLRGRARLIPFITAIGASFFLQYAFAGLFGFGQKSYPSVPALFGTFEVGGFTILRTQAVVIVVAVLMMVGLYLFIERTKAGKAIRAVSEDQEIARLMGVNVDRAIAGVFAVGGAMAGVAGVLWGVVFGQINFFTGFIPGIKAFTASVLGGIGNVVGAMLGGVTLGIVEALGPSLVLTGLGVPAANQLKDFFAFSMLVLVLIFRPTGILGERLAEERG